MHMPLSKGKIKLFLGGKMVFSLLQSSSNSLFQPFYNTELGTAGGGINPQKTRRYEKGGLRLELVVSWQVNLTKVYPCSWAHLGYFQCWEKHGLPRANLNGNGSENVKAALGGDKSHKGHGPGHLHGITCANKWHPYALSLGSSESSQPKGGAGGR